MKYIYNHIYIYIILYVVKLISMHAVLLSLVKFSVFVKYFLRHI